MNVTRRAAAPEVEQPPEQLRYARVLEAGARLGMIVLVASFVVYALGWLPAQVAVDRLPQLWSLPVDQFLAQTGAPRGWGWLPQVGHGDVAGLLGIAILIGASVPGLLALLPMAVRDGERPLAVLILLETAVIVIAASGLLTGAH